MSHLSAALKQPLLHFLLLGLLLFAGVSFFNNTPNASSRHIVVSDAALLDYVQYRNRAFNKQAAIHFIQQMSASERNALAAGFVREQALYREAIQLRLEQEDYVIKQRLVQKMEYLSRGFGANTITLTDSDIEQYYNNHPERYHKAASMTFSHIFFKTGSINKSKILALQQQLNKNHIPFRAATEYGQQFIYHSNYVERAPTLVSSHFDPDFAKAVFALSVNEQQWQGPLQSKHGLHLLMLIKKTEQTLPPLKTIYPQVKADALHARLNEQTEVNIQVIIDSYTLDYDSRYLNIMP